MITVYIFQKLLNYNPKVNIKYSLRLRSGPAGSRATATAPGPDRPPAAAAGRPARPGRRAVPGFPADFLGTTLSSPSTLRSKPNPCPAEHSPASMHPSRCNTVERVASPRPSRLITLSASLALCIVALCAMPIVAGASSGCAAGCASNPSLIFFIVRDFEFFPCSIYCTALRCKASLSFLSFSRPRQCSPPPPRVSFLAPWHHDSHLVLRSGPDLAHGGACVPCEAGFFCVVNTTFNARGAVDGQGTVSRWRHF
jgi:hypothetical protein